MFTAQHYVKVARVISELEVGEEERSKMIAAFAVMFMEDSEKFNVGAFWDACQKREEEEDGNN